MNMQKIKPNKYYKITITVGSYTTGTPSELEFYEHIREVIKDCYYSNETLFNNHIEDYTKTIDMGVSLSSIKAIKEITKEEFENMRFMIKTGIINK